MALSKEVRKLANKWDGGSSWPKRLEWLEITAIRGWRGQRLDLMFPFTAIVGENGSGKSTILQAIAAVHQSPQDPLKSYFASNFFPDTAWETITDGIIRYSVREGHRSTPGSVRKPSTRWRGNPERPKRTVYYIDLRRAQPYAAQIGYPRLAKPQFSEARREIFSADRIGRLSSVMGRDYSSAAFSLTTGDENRWVPVLDVRGVEYSGFHQGAGEAAIADLLKLDFERNSVVLIDELETSLHPRAQRRLVQDLAQQCREKELQIVVTTHSPYVMEELPDIARVYVMKTPVGREFVTGVSTDFALSKMDEEPHPELDVYVEDHSARILFEEIVAAKRLHILAQCEVIAYGSAQVGKSLGRMVHEDRFPRRSLVILDGDQEPSEGCLILPGDDAPERVVFEALSQRGWPDVATIIARSHSDLADAAETAMTAEDHHGWIRLVADKIIIGGHELWRVMCRSWARHCMTDGEATPIIEALEQVVNVRGVVPPGRLFTGMEFVDASPPVGPATMPE